MANIPCLHFSAIDVVEVQPCIPFLFSSHAIMMEKIHDKESD